MTRDEILALCDSGPRDEEATQRALAWQIEDRDTLEWALGILAEYEDEKAAIRRSAEAARAQVAAREAELLRRVDRSTSFLRSQVEGYARQHRKELIGSRGKTANLIHGTIQFRTHPEGIDIKDPAAALEWCMAQPVEADLTRTKVEINKRTLAAHVKGTGEIPPGVAYVPAREDIVIKPEAPDTINIAPTRKALP